MPRTSSHTSKRPGPSEAELSLQWEIKRLRGEVAALQKQGEFNERGDRLGDRLEGVSRGVLLVKIQRLWRNTIVGLVPEDQRCAQCGSVSFEASEAAFAQEAERLGQVELEQTHGRARKAR